MGNVELDEGGVYAGCEGTLELPEPDAGPDGDE